VIDRCPSHPWIARVGEGVAAGTAQHVRVGLELQAAGRGKRRALLADGDEGRRWALATVAFYVLVRLSPSPW
jgi:hypothetical protein